MKNWNEKFNNLIKATTDALKEELVIDCIDCWSDSQIPFHWIKNIKKEWKLWVNYRVIKIRSWTKRRYARSQEYLADIAPGEVSPSVAVNKDSLWFGPQYLNSLYAEDWRSYFRKCQ